MGPKINTLARGWKTEVRLCYLRRHDTGFFTSTAEGFKKFKEGVRESAKEESAEPGCSVNTDSAVVVVVVVVTLIPTPRLSLVGALCMVDNREALRGLDFDRARPILEGEPKAGAASPPA